MKFEIINPSDEAFIEGTFKACAIATSLLGEGHYGLERVNGNLTMPIMIFGYNKDWYEKTFGKKFEQLIDEIGLKKIVKALKTVKTATKSSLNDIEKRAKEIAENMKRLEKK